jgi:hypothetical protein
VVTHNFIVPVVEQQVNQVQFLRQLRKVDVHQHVEQVFAAQNGDSKQHSN